MNLILIQLFYVILSYRIMYLISFISKSNSAYIVESAEKQIDQTLRSADVKFPFNLHKFTFIFFLIRIAKSSEKYSNFHILLIFSHIC